MNERRVCWLFCLICYGSIFVVLNLQKAVIQDINVKLDSIGSMMDNIADGVYER